MLETPLGFITLTRAGTGSLFGNAMDEYLLALVLRLPLTGFLLTMLGYDAGARCSGFTQEENPTEKSSRLTTTCSSTTLLTKST